MAEAAEQGRRLEQSVAAFFGQNGYATTCNAVLFGRSGGRHEVDVLAEKADALTTYKVAIECKAWQRPIEKDVIAKLHYVMVDLGINKGIVVSLAGSRAGADRTAADLGIDLWGPDELRRHLGNAAVGSLTLPGASRQPHSTEWGYAPVVTPDQALPMIQTTTARRLRKRNLDRVILLTPAWIPAHAIGLTTTSAVQIRRRTELRSTTSYNLYEALTGTCLGPVPAPWQRVHVEQRLSLPAVVRPTKVVASIRQAFDSYTRVTTDAAIHRHATRLAELGVGTPCTSLAVENPALVYLPFVVGVLDAFGHQRAVGVDAATGVISAVVSAILTRSIPILRSTFGLPG
jgi:hypothetical protein